METDFLQFQYFRLKGYEDFPDKTIFKPIEYNEDGSLKVLYPNKVDGTLELTHLENLSRYEVTALTQDEVTAIQTNLHSASKKAHRKLVEARRLFEKAQNELSLSGVTSLDESQSIILVNFNAGMSL